MPVTAGAGAVETTIPSEPMKVTDSLLSRRLEALEEPGHGATVVDRIRYLITLMRKTQAQFGELINIDPTNMSKIMSGKIPVTDRTINRIVVNLGVSKAWLTEGKDVPFPKSVSDDVVTVTDTGERVALISVGAPVYDIDVTAGSQELSRMFTEDRIIGRLQMPSIDDNHPLVRVTGDSMSPKIVNNGYIQIRPISDMSPIFWGHIYLVVMEDYRMVKQIRRHDNPNKVILRSFNPDYDDMEVDRLDIKRLYLVEAIFNYDVIA